MGLSENWLHPPPQMAGGEMILVQWISVPSCSDKPQGENEPMPETIALHKH